MIAKEMVSAIYSGRLPGYASRTSALHKAAYCYRELRNDSEYFIMPDRSAVYRKGAYYIATTFDELAKRFPGAKNALRRREETGYYG